MLLTGNYTEKIGPKMTSGEHAFNITMGLRALGCINYA
jgi:hypothetical protein